MRSCQAWTAQGFSRDWMWLILGLFLLWSNPGPAAGAPGGDQLDSGDSELAAGLKEALAVGTRSAVETVSRTDGYFGNDAVKIIMPENLRSVADTLGRIGFQPQVDEFILSMNRAAEKAAPEALSIFADALSAMTFEDARNILTGGDTAATDYFKEKTSDRIYEAFRPIIKLSMEEVGVTQAFQRVMDKYASLPLRREEVFDLDDYVTGKALGGLFTMVGEEEKKIRSDPAARVTDLLKKVFR